MNRILLISVLALCACSQSPSTVRITNDVAVAETPVAPKPEISARSEIVFYNGKNYKINMNPNDSGSTLVSVIGMSPRQQKDAKAFITSAFHHFNCRDSQRTKFLSQPAYVEGNWQTQVTCV